MVSRAYLSYVLRIAELNGQCSGEGVRYTKLNKEIVKKLLQVFQEWKQHRQK